MPQTPKICGQLRSCVPEDLLSLSLCIWNTNCSFPGEIKPWVNTAIVPRLSDAQDPRGTPSSPQTLSDFRDGLELNKHLLELPQSLGLPLARAHLFQSHQGHHPKAFCGQGRSLTFLIFRYSCKIWSWMVWKKRGKKKGIIFSSAGGIYWWFNVHNSSKFQPKFAALGRSNGQTSSDSLDIPDQTPLPVTSTWIPG